MKSYELIVETLNKLNPKKQIVIPEDFSEKKIWRLVMKEFIAYGKKQGYNPMGEVITHVMTGKYKSKTLTEDDKLMIRTIKKDVLNEDETGKNILMALSARRAMDEFWEKKEEEDGGLCARFHTGMCRAHFEGLTYLSPSRHNGLYYYNYKKILNVFLPNSECWKESKLFNFKAIAKEIKARYGIVLDKEMDFEKVLHTATFLPISFDDFVNIRSEEQCFSYKTAYKLYGEGIKYQFVEWFLRYCEELERCKNKPDYEYAFLFSYDGLINSWLYDAVLEMKNSDEILSMRNYKKVKKALFDVSLRGSKKYYLGNPEKVNWLFGLEFERMFFG